MGLWSGLSRLLGGAPSRPGHAPGPRQTSGGWASLPPIQRAAGPVELTAQTVSFVRRLPGATRPHLAAQPLGHERRLDAPRGLVDITGPITAQAWADRGPLSFWRRLPGRGNSGGRTEAWAHDEVPVPVAQEAPGHLEPVAQEAPADLEPVAREVPADLEPVAEEVPADLEPVAREVPVGPEPGAPLPAVEGTSLAPRPIQRVAQVEPGPGGALPVLRPRPVPVARSDAPPSLAAGRLTEASSAFTLAPAAGPGQVVRPEEPAVPNRGAGLDVPPSLPSPSEGGGEGGGNRTSLPAQRLNLGQSRRYGLVRPRPLAAQRSPDPSIAGPESSSTPAPSADAPVKPSPPAESYSPPASPASEAGSPPGPRDVPASGAGTPGSTTGAESGPGPLVRSLPVPAHEQRAPGGGVEPVRERQVSLPSAAGLAAPIFRVQRRAGTSASPDEPAAPGVPAVVRRPAGGAGGTREPGAAVPEAFEPEPAAPPQRSEDQAGGPPAGFLAEPEALSAAASGPASASGSPPALPLPAAAPARAVAAPVQRLALTAAATPRTAPVLPLTGARPVLTAPAGAITPPAGAITPPAGAWTAAPLEPRMALAPAGAAATMPSSGSGRVSSPSEPEIVFPAPIVNRLLEQPITVSPPAPAMLQRQAPEVLAPGAAIAGEQVASPGPEAGAPSGHGSAPPPSDQELDDLAGKLYDRFRARFRMELLIDRERAGLITDLR